MAFFSLLCSLLLIVTCWTMVTIFVFGPLAIYFARKSYQRSVARSYRMGPGARLLALAPMLIAVAAIVLTVTIIGTGYRA